VWFGSRSLIIQVVQPISLVIVTGTRGEFSVGANIQHKETSFFIKNKFIKNERLNNNFP